MKFALRPAGEAGEREGVAKTCLNIFFGVRIFSIRGEKYNQFQNAPKHPKFSCCAPYDVHVIRWIIAQP